MTADGRKGSVAHRFGLTLFAWILAAYPRQFRDRYGTEMRATFRARQDAALRRRGTLALAPFWIREAAGGVWAGARLRVRVTGEGRDSPRNGREREGRVDTLRQDLRNGMRFLRRSPGFTATAVTVLALGIGATTAIFTAVHTVLLTPLPVHEPDRLVALWESNPEKGWAPEDQTSVAPANALNWREQVDAFADLALYNEYIQDAVLTGQGDPTRVGAGVVTGNWFSVIGVEPRLGRAFTWDETWRTGEPVTVITHGLWQRAFGGDPGILGRTLTVDGRTLEIVGVLPEGYRHPVEPVELIVPYGWDPAFRDQVWFRRAHLARGVARLAPGAAVVEAQSQLDAVAARLEQDYPETNRSMGAGMTPLHTYLTGDRRQPLLFLMGAVAVLLLLACVNVGNLFLVRAVGRAREMAVRAALGAGRRRLVRQVFAESLMVSVVGGLLGFAVGLAALRAFSRFAPPDIPDLSAAALGTAPLAFALAVTLACGLLFGAVPVLRGVATDLVDPLKDGSRGGTAGAGALRAVNVLVSAEVALALLLVLGAALLARSLWALRAVDGGFDGSGVVTFALEPDSRYETAADRIALYQEMETALASLPGVRQVGAVRALPLTGRQWSSDFSVEGRVPDDYYVEVNHREATAGYYETLRVPLLAGRLFDGRDRGDAPLAVVVNEALVEAAFPGGGNPIGRRLAFTRSPDENSTWWTIVGVVGNERYSPRAEPIPEIVAHAYQDPPGALRYVIRAELEPAAVVSAARETLRRIDPNLVLMEVRTLDDVRRAALLQERFLTSLLAAFAAVALLLATVGVYGVSAQMARRRTREIGIRMALGADASRVMGMVLRQGLGLTVAGVAVGLVAALAASRVMAGLLYGVEPVDGATYVAVPAILGIAALLAAAGPARRATRVDPVTALRTE